MNQNRYISVRCGQPFEIKLPKEASGGGYLWELKFNDFEFKLLEKKYPKPIFGVGSPRNVVFVLKPIYTGAAFITAVHKRPWEEEVLEQTVFTIKSYGDVAESGLLHLS